MEKVLSIVCAFTGVGVSVFMFPEGPAAVLLCTILSLIAVFIIKRLGEESGFLLQIFFGALLVRILLGTTINVFGWELFFGGDALTYDERGYRLLQIWLGQSSANDLVDQAVTSTSGSGWGMYYIVGAVYAIFGRNMLAVQYSSSVVGAVTAVVIYVCSYRIFNNIRVARVSAIIVAFFPSLVLWSCQMLKDGFIIFLLVMIMLSLLKLLEKFSYVYLFILIFSLFGVISLRFYIFYMIAAAVAGSFVVGLGKSAQSLFGRLVAVLLIGLSITYLGVLNKASENFERYGSLEAVQSTRKALATHSAVGKVNSGFGEDLDVSTTEGAISAIPIGMTYLMLAPFPWQIQNFRQAITLPEMLLWWASLPLLVMGLWHTVKHRLRAAIGILMFTSMLIISYAIFSGNVGTAYRQRAQIQVFLFIFISVGWTLLKEKRENKIHLKNRR